MRYRFMCDIFLDYEDEYEDEDNYDYEDSYDEYD